MKIINIQAAKTHLSRLVEEAAEGGDIVIAKAGKPIVRLVPCGAVEGGRKLGFLAGKGWEAPDCWESDAEIEDMFYGGPLEPSAMRVAEAPSSETRAKDGKKTASPHKAPITNNQ